jgi:hypothetical protein
MGTRRYFRKECSEGTPLILLVSSILMVTIFLLSLSILLITQVEFLLEEVRVVTMRLVSHYYYLYLYPVIHELQYCGKKKLIVIIAFNIWIAISSFFEQNLDKFAWSICSYLFARLVFQFRSSVIIHITNFTLFFCCNI